MAWTFLPLHYSPARGDNPIKQYYNYWLLKQRTGNITIVEGNPLVKFGTGKSWCAIRLATVIDDCWDLNKLAFEPTEFLKAFDYVESLGKPSQAIVVDEGEITAPASAWFSFYNRAIAYSLATFRYLQCSVLFVCPNMEWLDKRVRLLANTLIQVKKNIYDAQGNRHDEVEARVYQMVTYRINEQLRIFYKPLEAYNDDLKRLENVSAFKVDRLEDRWALPYEELHRSRKKNLRPSLLLEMQNFKAKSEGTSGQRRDLVKMANDCLDSEDIRGDLLSRGRVSGNTIAGFFASKGDVLDNYTANTLKQMVERHWRKVAVKP